MHRQGRSVFLYGPGVKDRGGGPTWVSLPCLYALFDLRRSIPGRGVIESRPYDTHQNLQTHMSTPLNINLRILALLAVTGLCSSFDDAAGEVVLWRLGGEEGHSWGDWANMKVMVDDFSVPGAMQPFELHPDSNLVTQLGHWQRHKFPWDPDYRPGHPRIWRGVNWTVNNDGYPANYVDGDTTSFNTPRNWSWWRLKPEFDTLDFGAPAPVERFVFYPPAGTDGVTDEPYREKWVLQNFELSGGNDTVTIQQEEGEDYRPLEVMLAQVERNFDWYTQVRFPLQYFRFLRFRVIGDAAEGQFLTQFAIAEMEVYGRGFAPEVMYESRAVDLGQEVNVGRVFFGVSPWRKEGERTVPAPEGPVSVSVEIKTGRDDSPLAYFGYNDQGEPVEVTQAEYGELRPRVYAWDPPVVGWRGPFTEDQEDWSFWSVPLRESGMRPGVPPGQYFQLRVKLGTEGLWEYVRVDSLAVEFFPLLADRVVGEVAAVGDPTPEGGVAQVRIGERTELVYVMRAEFTGKDRSGFDAVRIFTPSEADSIRLAMGDPPAVVVPDSVRSDGGGVTVYLPRRIEMDASLRIRLATTLYGGSAKLEGEVFDRRESAMRQRIDEGDATEDVSTNRLQVLASGASLDRILGEVAILPRSITPNQDGRNARTRITYTLFGVEGADVEVAFYTLTGKRVRRISERQQVGPHTVEWEGLDDTGRLVTPGLYLCRVAAQTDRGTFETVKPIAVVY